MKKILIVEDNTEMNEMISTILGSEYTVHQAFSGTEALLLFKQETFDLVLLDRMLPGKDGQAVLKAIRQSSQVPVIMLTALADKQEIAEFLINGANDYLTKPFNIDELKARIVVQLRQTTGTLPETVVHFKKITLLPDTFALQGPTETVQLKRKEFDILQLLLNHPKKVYTKEMLYEEVWGEAYYGDENTINVHISNLRKKLKEVDEANTYIDTVWGIGVKLAEEG
ncbi:MAG: response regulator transcription factor [Enterococcus sp.]